MIGFFVVVEVSGQGVELSDVFEVSEHVRGGASYISVVDACAEADGVIWVVVVGARKLDADHRDEESQGVSCAHAVLGEYRGPKGFA